MMRPILPGLRTCPVLGRSENLALTGGPAHRALLQSPSPGPISSPALVVTAVVIDAAIAGGSRVAVVHHKSSRPLLEKDVGDREVSCSQEICLPPPVYDDKIKGCPVIADVSTRAVGLDAVTAGTTHGHID